MNPAISNSSVRVTLVLEPLDSGGVVASVMEFPQCRVEAQTRDRAISQIKTDLAALLNRLELLSIEISPESPWVKYAGMFQDDPDFAAIASDIRSERDLEDDTEVDPAIYNLEPLGE